MGRSCYSNRSQAGAFQNKRPSMKTEDHALRFLKDTQQRLRQFERQEKEDLEAYKKYDKVKFYPKTN
ncbi:MAG: hypothetical protein ACPIOQ_14960 [Promethearchaeia archaeon]